MGVSLPVSLNPWYNTSMFIKITSSGKYRYAQLVESYRQGDATKHKVLLNLGRVDYIKDNPSFQNLARRLAELSGVQKSLDISSISEAEVVNWGYRVYRKLWDRFGIGEILRRLTASTKVQFDLDATSFLMAIQHLLEPSSKLGSYRKQQRYLGLPEVELNHLYRSLDILAEGKEDIEENLFLKGRTLFNMKVDVVFFDVTTFEGNTLEPVLDKFNRRYGIRQVIIVADRGLNQKMNLKRIVDKGYDYVVASKLKVMKKEVKDAFFTPGYTVISQEDEELRYKVIDYVNEVKDGPAAYQLKEKLIITYSSKRAEKDRADRRRLIDKAESLLKSKAKIKADYKRGGRKYLKGVGDKVDWILDENAIAKDEMFDGYYGIQTSVKNLSAPEVLSVFVPSLFVQQLPG